MSLLKCQLLGLLREFTEEFGTMHPRDAHLQAEDLLLRIVDDDEINKAWKDASDLWWYS